MDLENIVVDITQRNYNTLQTIQYDVDSRYVNVKIVNNGKNVDLTNYMVSIACKKPDGKIVFNETEMIEPKQGLIKFLISEQITAILGEVVCELKIYGKNSSVLTTQYFTINVTQPIANKTIQSTNEFRQLTIVMNEYNKWIDKVEEKYNGLEEEYAEELTSVKNKINSVNKQLRINIYDLGVVGDGSDVTEAFGDAINYCVDNNIRELFLPEGIYKITKTIETRGINLVGAGSYTPFLTWDYTSPSGADLYEKFLAQCSGTIITSPNDITLLKGAINLKDIGLFGNRRATNQEGVLVDISCNLFNVKIVGFGKCAISMINGAINPYIEKCFLEQNVYGIIFGDNVATFTGESNRITIRDTSFNRCENAGIYGVSRGRHFVIDNNTFEAIGEPTDPTRPKPTNYADTKFAIDLTLKNTANWTNGSMTITNNYLEETYGFIKLTADTVIRAIKIENTLWQPLDQINYSCFCCVSGRIDGLKIINNNIYTQHDYIKILDDGVKDFDIDVPCNYTANAYRIQDNTGFSKSVYSETSSLAYDEYCSFGSGFITHTTFDDVSYKSHKYVGDVGVTYFSFNPNQANGFDFGPQNTFENYVHSGYALIVGGNFMGVIVGLGTNLFVVRGNRTGISIGDGSARLVRLPGHRVLNAGGGSNKVIYDHDLFPIPFGK